jgi:hypothetical protein
VAVSFARSSTGASGGVGFQAPIPPHTMPEALLSQHTVSRVIGQSRLRRLCRAGWFKPVKSNAHSILFSPRDVHLAFRKLERQRLVRLTGSRSPESAPRKHETVIHGFGRFDRSPRALVSSSWTSVRFISESCM